jgi:hypothetical protein
MSAELINALREILRCEKSSYAFPKDVFVGTNLESYAVTIYNTMTSDSSALYGSSRNYTIKFVLDTCTVFLDYASTIQDAIDRIRVFFNDTFYTRSEDGHLIPSPRIGELVKASLIPKSALTTTENSFERALTACMTTETTVVLPSLIFLGTFFHEYIIEIDSLRSDSRTRYNVSAKKKGCSPEYVLFEVKWLDSLGTIQTIIRDYVRNLAEEEVSLDRPEPNAMGAMNDGRSYSIADARAYFGIH